MTSAVRVPEAGLQRAVIDLAKLTGWLVHHTRPAQTKRGWRTPIQGDVGFPDLVLVKGHRVLFVELKSKRGRVTPDQEAWIMALALAGANIHVWRPVDWPVIERTLKGEG